jgi:hypothetical protein
LVERRLAKAKVASSNLVFRSNHKSPALLRNLSRAGLSLFGFLTRLDPSWTQRKRFGLSLDFQRVRQHASRLAQGLHRLAEIGDVEVPRKSAAARAATLALGSVCQASVLQCPEGLDPDQLVQRDGKDGFLQRVAGATSCADFLISHDLGGFTARHAVEERVAALYRLAGQFEAAGVQFTAAQTRRLASLVGCEQSTMERVLEPRGLLEHR